MTPPDRLTPIYSAHSDDPARNEAIDAFVIHLAERIDHLQDAESRADVGQVAELGLALAQEAAGVGYDEFSRVARAAVDAARDGKSEEAHNALVELTDLSHRIRLGHRGSL